MSGQPAAILVGCVKRKVDRPAAAKDLYCSPLFRKRRAYAERTGRLWMILSAKYGLLDPEERIHPYDVALGDLPAARRRCWGEQVADALEERIGPLKGTNFEVHAGASYLGAVISPLEERGGTVTAPLQGLPLGAQLRWYGDDIRTARRRRIATAAEVRRALRDLDASPTLIEAHAWPGSATGLNQPGVYSWWVDAGGAKDLARGLGARVSAGRIYAGQTGATKWPSGKAGKGTLGARIRANHLQGSIGASTFRLTLAAALGTPSGAAGRRTIEPPAKQWLTDWMRAHLTVAVHPFPNRDALMDLEDRVLAVLDPPLNLDGMRPTPLRQALTQLRASTIRP